MKPEYGEWGYVNCCKKHKASAMLNAHNYDFRHAKELEA